jgi:hypothetical protein
LYPCHPNCGSCIETGTDLDNKCITCAPGLALKSGTKNCITGLQNKFYYDESKKTYVNCYPSCLTCIEAGTPEDHNCRTCESKYYFIEGTRSCFLENDKVDFYIFKAQDKIFKKCQDSCKTCSHPKNYDGILDYCITCKDGYIKSIEKDSNCYKQDKERFYVSFNKDRYENLLYPCFESCLTCYGYGDFINHNCSKCDELNGYYNQNENDKISQKGFNCLNKKLPSYGTFLNNNTNKFENCAKLNNKDNNKNLKISSFVPNFLDLYTPTDIQIKFNNYLSQTIDEYKIIDIYLEAILSDGKSIRYGMVKRGISCNILNVFFSPPKKISGFNKEKENRILQQKQNIGYFKLYFTKGNGNLIEVETKKINVLISENKIPDALKEDSNDFDSLFQSYIFSNNITQNLILRTVKGNAIQIYKGNSDSLTLASDLSFDNSLSYFDLNNCITNIIDYYNEEYKKANSTIILKKEDILIFQVDYAPKIMHFDSYYNGYRTKVYPYNLISVAKEKIDLSICKENIKINIPSNSLYPHNSPLNYTNAFIFKDKFNVDIYDYNGRLYTDICFKYFENITDFTINDRRRFIFPNIKITCPDNCEFEGLNLENKYSTCNCKPIAISDFTLNYFNSTLNDISITNLNLFSCFLILFDDSLENKNIGFYFGIAVLILYFFNLFLYTILPVIYKKIEKNKIDNLNKSNNNNESISEINVYENSNANANENNEENKKKNNNNYDNNNLVIQNSKEKTYYEITFSIFEDFIHKRIYNIDKIEYDKKAHLNSLINLKKLILSEGCNFISIDQKLKKKILNKLVDEKNLNEKVKESIRVNKVTEEDFLFKINLNRNRNKGNNNNKENEIYNNKNELNFKLKKNKNKEKKYKENLKVKFIKISSDEQNQEKTKFNIIDIDKENDNISNKNNLLYSNKPIFNNESKLNIEINNKTLNSNNVDNLLRISNLNINDKSKDNRLNFTDNNNDNIINNLNKNKNNNNNKSQDLYKNISHINLEDNSLGGGYNINENFKNNPYIINNIGYKRDNLGKINKIE